MVSKEVKDEVNKILESSAGGMVQWNQIEAVLLKAGLAYHQEVAPEFLAVHPMNRASTGINAYNMHSKGAMICRAGADPNQLGGSVCFEVNTLQRSQQIGFTHSLAEQSSGLIAKPSGMERFLSVSKSHTSQFMKAIKSNCKTNQPTLAGGDGCLGTHLLSKDPALSYLVHSGWKWTIIHACVEVEWPQLPSLIESALNSSNASYETQNEVQLMAAVLFKLQGLPHGEKIDLGALANDLCHGGQLKSYSHAVGKFVQHYGGQLGLILLHNHGWLQGLI